MAPGGRIRSESRIEPWYPFIGDGGEAPPVVEEALYLGLAPFGFSIPYGVTSVDCASALAYPNAVVRSIWESGTTNAYVEDGDTVLIHAVAVGSSITPPAGWTTVVSGSLGGASDGYYLVCMIDHINLAATTTLGFPGGLIPGGGSNAPSPFALSGLWAWQLFRDVPATWSLAATTPVKHLASASFNLSLPNPSWSLGWGEVLGSSYDYGGNSWTMGWPYFELHMDRDPDGYGWDPGYNLDAVSQLPWFTAITIPGITLPTTVPVAFQFPPDWDGSGGPPPEADPGVPSTFPTPYDAVTFALGWVAS